MKFKIKGEKLDSPEIEFWLEIIGEAVGLKGRDNDGTQKNIMHFENGKFRRETDAQLEGLETDGMGQIMEEK